VPHPASIRADDLRLVLAAHKLRRRTHSGSPALCVLSPGPWLPVDCATSSRHSRPGLIADARRLGARASGPQLLLRGHIARLIERTRLEHGLAEIRRTWRIGLRTLLAEPRHVLHGGQTAAAQG
jgi:hypothetical protein